MIWSIAQTAVFGYMTSSLCLFAFPSLLHKQVVQPKLFKEAIKGKRVLRIAHRGGPRDAMENTLIAFDRCLPKTDMLEMDVCETKDGVLVVHHDKSLMRTCGIQK